MYVRVCTRSLCTCIFAGTHDASVCLCIMCIRYILHTYISHTYIEIETIEKRAMHHDASCHKYCPIHRADKGVHFLNQGTGSRPFRSGSGPRFGELGWEALAAWSKGCNRMQEVPGSKASNHKEHDRVYKTRSCRARRR